MKASELVNRIKTMISLFGDLEIVFRDEFENNIYSIEDIVVKHSKLEDDKHIITGFFKNVDKL